VKSNDKSQPGIYVEYIPKRITSCNFMKLWQSRSKHHWGNVKLFGGGRH